MLGADLPATLPDKAPGCSLPLPNSPNSILRRLTIWDKFFFPFFPSLVLFILTFPAEVFEIYF